MRTITTTSVFAAARRAGFAALLMLIAIAMSVSTASAVTIADFQFTGSSFASTDPGTNWSTSDLTTGAGLPLTTSGGGSSSGSIGNPVPAAEVRYDDLENQTTSDVTLAETISFNNYYSFTVTPAGGVSLNLSQLGFELAKTGGNNVSAHVFSDVGGFTEFDVIDSFTAPASGLGTALIDVSALSDITTPIELRIYLSRTVASTMANTIFTENILLTGDVVLPPVPEPSSLMLLILGTIGLVRQTRRRLRRA